MKDLYGIK